MGCNIKRHLVHPQSTVFEKMSYAFESDLIIKLRRYDELNKTLATLTKEKDLIRKQISQWRELNKIKHEVLIMDENVTWNIDTYTRNSSSVIDFNTLINKLGDEASVFIKKSETEILKISKK